MLFFPLGWPCSAEPAHVNQYPMWRKWPCSPISHSTESTPAFCVIPPTLYICSRYVRVRDYLILGNLPYIRCLIPLFLHRCICSVLFKIRHSFFCECELFSHRERWRGLECVAGTISLIGSIYLGAGICKWYTNMGRVTPSVKATSAALALSWTPNCEIQSEHFLKPSAQRTLAFYVYDLIGW